jgi:hypothetical protein
MKAIPLLIAVSLLANAAFAFKWWRSRPSTPAAEAPAAAPENQPSGQTAAAAKPRRGEPPTSPVAAPATPALPAKPTWAQLFSATDLKGSIQRLRAVGCPEETIQDLISAEVTRRYAEKSQAIWRRTDEDKYWVATNQEEMMAGSERSKQYAALEKERVALLTDLLGFDPQKRQREESGIPDYRDRQLGFLPPEKREAVQRYLEEFQAKENDHYRRNRGLYDAQERAERKELQAEKERGLAALLSPEEFRQWELRSSQMASQLQSEITTMSLTQAQYETLFSLRKQAGDSLYLWGDQANDSQARERSEQAKKQLVADIKAALGDEVAREWELARTPFYSELFRMAKAENLPADTARKVFSYKEQAEAKAREVRAMRDLPREQQQQTLAALRAETETAMKATLGEQLYERYKPRAYWLNSISYTPTRPTAPVPATKQP